MAPVGTALLRGSRDERLRALRDGDPHYLLINYEGLAILEPELRAMVASGEIANVVIDEFTAYGNAQSARWKAADRVINGPAGERRGDRGWMPAPTAARRVWALSGTPSADVVGAFGYARLVNPRQLLYRSLTSWRHATTDKWGPEPWQYRPRPEAQDIVHRTLQPCVRHVKEEVLPFLPAVRVETVRVGLSAEQLEAHGRLRAAGRALLAGGGEIKANNKAILMQKLFQVSLGHVRAQDGRVARLDAGPRLEVLGRLVESTPRKTVIFGAYVNVNAALADWLRARGHSAERVDSSVTGARRDAIFGDFQKERDPRALVVHPRTTAYGTELAVADKIIFNGPMLSGLHVYLQAIERLSSAKQTAAEVRIYCVFGTREEEAFQGRLNGLARWADCVADSFNILVRED
jgi:hypothetical protein